MQGRRWGCYALSHYSVTVVTKEKPTQKILDTALNPFYEVECTGNFLSPFDETIDITDEALHEYNSRDQKDQQKPFELYVKEYYDAVLISSDIDIKNINKPFILQYVVNEETGQQELKVYRKTNPNAKWDWWTVGGRWAGLFDGETIVQKKRFVYNIEEHATFALLYNDEWKERGQEGWWGKVSDESTEEDWFASVKKIYDAIPEDHYLTVVDCHI